MRIGSRSHLEVSVLLLSSIILCSLPGILSSRYVTLASIQIFATHEWFNAKPTVYFHCQGGNKTILPDVKKTHFIYTFKGEESWQPLTELPDSKCKRCGFYEKDTITSDDVFDEWELCLADFMAPDGKYVRFKDKEFNATFMCPECARTESGSVRSSRSENGDTHKGMSVILVIMISAIVSVVSVTGLVALYRYWQRKKREQDHARFLKLFEEGDDIEDELGLGHVI
ncbi:uncharacterized protein LOC143849758 isoform X1 [Tasmannia lanceolata]|uniref:uncharacterized protein LOC143849758 isoform X1 n=1 Tax=Tasmannia lanceolata TaxID=3420 RepID=UPI004063AD1A